VTAAALAALLVSAGACSADVIALTPTADSRIMALYKDNNDGGLFSLSVYNDGTDNIQRSFVLFDLSAVPPGGITKAVLRFTDRDLGYTGNGKAVYAYRTTAPWSETQITWNRRTTASPWHTPGGDFVGTTGVQNSSPYAAALDDPATRSVSLDVTTLVKQWLAGTHPNYGFAITSQTGNQLHFHARENAYGAATVRPTLLIETAAAAPAVYVSRVDNTLIWQPPGVEPHLLGYWMVEQVIHVTNRGTSRAANVVLNNIRWHTYSAQLPVTFGLWITYPPVSPSNPALFGTLEPGETRSLRVLYLPDTWIGDNRRPPIAAGTPMQFSYSGPGISGLLRSIPFPGIP
jgi:hypothetical protein